MENKNKYESFYTYIDHKVIDEITHHIMFDKDLNIFKIKIIDYLSIYSNSLLIRSMHTGTTVFKGEEIPTIILTCRCDMKEIKKLINYLLD